MQATMTLGNTDTKSTFLAQLDRHAPILRKVAGTYGWTRQDRHDLMQEISLQLWKAWPDYDRSRPFSTWMYRIALNVGISHLRSARQPHRQAMSLDDLDRDPAGSDDQTDLDERLVLLRRFIGSLDPFNRALLLLYMEERSHREIADILGLSESNVGTRISRLKQKVRQDLTQD